MRPPFLARTASAFLSRASFDMRLIAYIISSFVGVPSFMNGLSLRGLWLGGLDICCWWRRRTAAGDDFISTTSGIFPLVLAVVWAVMLGRPVVMMRGAGAAGRSCGKDWDRCHLWAIILGETAGSIYTSRKPFYPVFKLKLFWGTIFLSYDVYLHRYLPRDTTWVHAVPRDTTWGCTIAIRSRHDKNRYYIYGVGRHIYRYAVILYLFERVRFNCKRVPWRVPTLLPSPQQPCTKWAQLLSLP